MFSKQITELNTQILRAEAEVTMHDARLSRGFKDINQRAQTQIDRARSHAGSILSVGGVVAAVGMFFMRGRAAKRRREFPAARTDSLRSLVMPILAPIVGREAAALLGALSASPTARAAAPLQTVSNLDLQRYAGRWFEVARLPNRFETSCVSHVTADYQVVDNELAIVNSCLSKKGKMNSVHGRARMPDPKHPGKLKLSFLPSWLSWLPMGGSDYWIIALAADYSTALVGTPDRRTIWFLSRSPQIASSTYDRLLALAASEGFDVGRVRKTPQSLS